MGLNPFLGLCINLPHINSNLHLHFNISLILRIFLHSTYHHVQYYVVKSL